MIDCINSTIEIPFNRTPSNVLKKVEEPFVWQGIDFYPADNGQFRAKKRSVQNNGLGGLRVTMGYGYYPYLNISNSLHKFFHNGINHNDFKLSEVNTAIEKLSDHLGLNYYTAHLKGRFEFAVNLDVRNAMDYIQNATAYKDSDVFKMKENGRFCGKRFELGSYHVKLYSPYQFQKAKQEELPTNENLLRTEIKAIGISYLRKMGIDIHTMQDLTERPKMQKLGETLSKYFSNIQHERLLPDDANLQDLEKYHFFRNATKQQRKQVRTNQKRTYERHMRTYKKLLKESEPLSAWFEEIPQRINEKWNVLLNS